MTMLQSCLKFFHSVVRILWPPVFVKFQCSTSNIKGDTATFYFLHLTRHFDHVIVYFNIVACLGRSAANSDNFNDARTMTVDRYFFILSPS